MTQVELVVRARAGDHDAFELLVRQSVPKLYGVAKLILRHPDRADDAIQDALMLAWRHLGALREPAAWEAWLYRLTVRSCHRLALRSHQLDTVELDTDGRRSGQPDFARAVDERDRMARQLGRVPVDQRTVIVLHFYVDLPLTDVAEILDIPIGTAKSRLHRGLETMRIAMSVDAEAPGRGRAEQLS